MTNSGFHKLKNELSVLEEEEKKAIEAIVIARGFGDFSENAELEAANNWLDRIRKNMEENAKKVSQSHIFDVSNIDKTKIGFGAQVELEDIETGKIMVYKIVGEFEANVQEGKLSIESPLAKALNGKKIGQDCVISAPSGEKNFEIKNIDYSWLIA
jgi:transcription elongation factor GreA